MERAAIQEAVLASFLCEVSALKPGNVSRYANGHGMTMDHFIQSANITTPLLCKTGATIGERVLESVRATNEMVCCNTNLGMVLLFAPLVKAAEECMDDRKMLRECLRIELENLDQRDTELVYAAIRLANPGGLGKSDNHDVASVPDCGLLEAMKYASNQDRIALQYTSVFEDIFKTGLSCIKDSTLRWNSVEWAAVACYLTLMADFPDSHIQRKFGPKIAEEIRIRTNPIARRFKQSQRPEDSVRQLLDFDKELKESNLNPGTSADLTAASLLVYNLYGD